jgi:PKD repeat protein
MRAIKTLFFGAVLVLLTNTAFSQCELLDGNGVPSTNPIWVGCSKVTSANDTDFIINVFPNGAFGPYTIDWGDGVVEVGTSLAPPFSLSHTYISVTGGTNFADTFFLTFTSGPCTIDGVVVSGYPVTANIGVPGGLTQLTCAPGELVFINNSNGSSNLPVMPSTVFTWDFGDGSPLLVFDGSNQFDTVRHTYQRNTVDCITQVDLTADNECNLSPSVNSQSPVLIYDLDDAAINASATVLCYPDTVVDFLNGSMMNCLPEGNTQQRYALWNFGDYWGLGYDSIVGWRRSVTPVQDAPAPLTIAYPGVGTYVVNMIDSNMCGQEPTSIIIEIVPPPDADFSLSDDTVCAGEQVTFTNLSLGGANVFRWNFDQGAGFQALGAGNQTRTFNTPGDFTITLAIRIAGSNCVDTIRKPLVVKPSPIASINLSDSVGCDSLSVVFTDNSTGTPLPNAWDWDFGNGFTSSDQNPNGTQFYPSPNNYTVSLTVTNSENCSNTTTTPVDVYLTPTPGFTATQVCAGELGDFTDTSFSSLGDPIVQWTWNFGDGSPTSPLQDPSHTYVTSGPYDVILEVATANCVARDTFPIVVEDLPTAGFSMDVTGGCAPLAVTFTNLSSANVVSAYWDFGDGDTSTALNPTHVFTNSGAIDSIYTVSLIAYTNFGCADTITQTITVFPNPNAGFFSDATLDCGPIIVNFTNTSSNGAVDYHWDFGDGDTSVLVHPRDTFENKTLFIEVYSVELIAISVNGCTDTAVQNITVYPEPQFGFGASPDSGCSPLTVTFPSVIGAVIYNWDFGDGIFGSGPTPSHTYFNNTNKDTTYNVRLIAQSPFGCVDTNYGAVKVFPSPTAQFSVDKDRGCPDLTVGFTNTSAGGVIYHWDFDDATLFDTIDLFVQHTFQNTGTTNQQYDAKLIVESANGCLDSLTKDITVYAPVVAAFTGDTAGCNPFEASFENASGPSATRFEWKFGDGGGSTAANPIHAYINLGTSPVQYPITFIASSALNCSDTATGEITIYPAPLAGFVATPEEQTYPDTLVEIENTTGGGAVWDYRWDFGDNTTSTNFGPLFMHPYNKRPEGRDYVAGSFIIKLVAGNKICEDSISKTVIINPPLPVPEFNIDSGCAPMTIQFENRSKYGIQYKWDFDDGFTSTEKNPKHLFLSHGSYNVELTVFGEVGEVSEQNQVDVYESPQAAFFVQPTRVFIPGNPVVAFNSSVGENLKFSWDFGDGSTSSVKDPQHFYRAEGEYTITLIADNGLCADTLIRRSAVTAIPGGSIRTPNAFTPNPGGPSNGGRYDPTATNNDIFFPLVDNAVEIEFTIYNKWGELLFFSDETDVGWDGYYKGRLSKQDVYVWKIKAKLIDGTEVIRVGDLTLIR